MRIYNLTDNDDAAIVAQQGIFQVMEWKRDFSVTYGSAMDAYYASEMNVRRRQLVCNLNGKTGAVVQAGAMQWAVGHIEVTTGVKGVGDFIGKLARGAVTNESAVKPEYHGNGVVVLEPTYRHVLLPSALRIVIPPLTSESMGIVKNSSVAFSVSVAELTMFARQAQEETSRGIEIYLAVTALYFITSILVYQVARLIEKRLRIPGTIGAGK